MSFICAAVESVDGGELINEVEYSQFLKLSGNTLSALIDNASEFKSIWFSEHKLPVHGASKSRLRFYPDNGDDTRFELTTKSPSPENKAKLEANKFIVNSMYTSLATLASQMVVRKRIFIPICHPNGDAITKRDGSNLAWELDIYYIPNADNVLTAYEWVKLELEVDKATLESVVEYIPFEYDEIIQSDSTVETDRAFISNLYDNVYNIIDNVNSIVMDKIA